MGKQELQQATQLKDIKNRMELDLVGGLNIMASLMYSDRKDNNLTIRQNENNIACNCIRHLPVYM